MFVRGAAISLWFALAAGSASAEGWTVKDLGSIDTESKCVDAAWEAFDHYRRSHSVGDLQRTEWVVYGYDLSYDEYDGIITCSFGPNDTNRATLAVHGGPGSDNSTRRDVANRIQRYWDQAN